MSHDREWRFRRINRAVEPSTHDVSGRRQYVRGQGVGRFAAAAARLTSLFNFRTLTNREIGQALSISTRTVVRTTKCARERSDAPKTWRQIENLSAKLARTSFGGFR